jgi:predicted GNAT superfamily acetyltransferase
VTEDPGVSLRPVEAADLSAVLHLNTAAVPAVNDLSADELAWFAEVAQTFLVVIQPAGDASGSEPGRIVHEISGQARTSWESDASGSEPGRIVHEISGQARTSWESDASGSESGSEPGRIVGFLVGLEGPGLDYASLNYRWFGERYERFLYVDRVVVDPAGQGRGLGRSLYEAFVERAEGHTALCAEVNIRPRNDGSLAFHDAFGFAPVGEQDTEAGSKRVRMFAKELLSRPSVSEK